MPSYNNTFQSPKFYEEKILDESGELIGTIRVKPSGVLWKPKNARKYFSVTLDKFTEWITSEAANARKTSS